MIRGRARDRAALAREPAGADPGRARHRARDCGARAAARPTRRASRLPPARAWRATRWRCSRRRATARSTAPRSAATRRPSRKASSFLLPKLEQHNTCAGVHAAASRSATSPPKGGSMPALLAALVGRRGDAAAAAAAARGHSGADRALLARASRRVTRARCWRRCSRPRVTALAAAYWPGNLDHLHNVVANLALTVRQRDHGRSRASGCWAKPRCRRPRRSRRRSPRAFSSCRCAKRARRSSGSISSSCWAGSRAT